MGSPWWRPKILHRGLSRQALFAFCILHCAFLVSCTHTAPRTAFTTQTPSAATVSSAPDPRLQLQSDILAATRSPGVQRGTWGIIVHSLDRNERLFELNPHALLVPASLTKLLSAATAGDAVGWDYRFTTTLKVSGPISDGVLQGDLVVVGTGDPSLGGRAGDEMNVLVDAVKAAGITRIDGRIIGNDDALEDARPALAWAWDDLGYPSGSLFGALNYAENRTVVTIAPGLVPGGPTTLTLDATAQGRPLINRTTTIARGSMQLLWPEQRPGETALTIGGTIVAGTSPARLNISTGNPTLWFATALKNRLTAAGIPVSGDAFDQDDLGPVGETMTISTYRSRTLGEFTVPMLKDSINLYAEAAMRLNSAPDVTPKTNDTALDGFKARLNAWGIPPDAYQVIDGSGLSRRDAVAPEVFLAVLQRMYDPTSQSPWMRALPIAGVDGSLNARMKGTAAENNLRAKTGTMSNIRTLAGYVTAANGEHLVVVVMVNDFEGAGATALQAIDTIGVALAKFKR